MKDVVALFDARLTRDWLQALPERERDEVLFEHVFEGCTRPLRLEVQPRSAERCLFTMKHPSHAPLHALCDEHAMDWWFAPGAYDDHRGPLLWEHLRRRHTRTLVMLVDADPLAMASAATWIAAQPADLALDVRWPMATTFVEQPPSNALISLTGWEKRVCESLTARELGTLRDAGWPALVSLWQRGYKVETDSVVLWRFAELERALTATSGA